jgi:branched-chain amino acid transport system permease protein
MDIVGQLVFDGLAMGLVYVILAGGFVLVLSVTQIFYIAYGMFYMVGAYAVWYGASVIHLPYFACLFIAPLLTAMLGMLTYILVFHRLRFAEERFLSTITAALGVSLMMSQGGLLIFGTVPRSIPAIIPGMISIMGANVSTDKIVLIGLGIAVTLFLFVVYEKTSIGRAMRAVSYLPETASLQGVNTNRVYTVTMGISCAVAGFAGGIIAPSYGLVPEMGQNVLLPVLLMCMLGGMDSLFGAVIGGLVVGQVLSFGQFFIGSSSQIVLFLVIAVVIFFRPNGLLGRKGDFGGF